MPCFNTQLNENAFTPEDKYKNNYFTYIGSLEKWQGFDHIIATYKKIEELQLPNTKLFVFTSDQAKAKSKLDSIGVCNYEIGFCKNEELPEKLKHIKYGFILREDNTVNRVATPTKLSTYMSCGLIPIYSKCIDSFHEMAINKKFVVEENEIIEKTKAFSEVQIQNSKILDEYRQVFSTYYSSNYHVSNLVRLLTNRFANK